MNSCLKPVEDDGGDLGLVVDVEIGQLDPEPEPLEQDL